MCLLSVFWPYDRRDMYALMINDIVLVMNQRAAPMSSRHLCLREMALQTRIGRARNIYTSVTVHLPKWETHDDEKDNRRCEVRADGFTTVEVVDSSSDVGVDVGHDD